MAKTISISFALSAALSGGFKGAFQGAAQSARAVTAAIRDMEKSPTGKLGQAMAQQKEKIKGLSASLKEAQATLAGLQAKARGAGGANGMLARQIQLAQGRVDSLNGALQRQIGQYRNTAAQAATTAGSVRNLARDYANLQNRMERARKVQGAMAANRAQGDALRAQRADLNSRLAGATAAAATVAIPAKLSIDFEQSIANVGAVANASDADLQRLTATARQLGRDTQYSAVEAAEGMKYLAMAGFDATDTIAAMPGMLDLAAASDTDLARTADIASNILTAFGMRADEMSIAADTLAKATTTSNTDLSMLGDTMKYVGPVANSLGMSLQDTAAYAGLMANAGIQASQGGTALRAALLRLASPPKMAREELGKLAGVEGEEIDHLLQMMEEDGGDAEGALKAIGMTTKDAAGNMRPLADILEELNARTADMGNAEKAAVFKNVFGSEASAAMIALADQAAITVDKYGNQIVDSLGRPTTAMRKFIEETNNYSGTAAQIAEKRMATTRGALLRLSSAWQDAGISIGNLFLPAIRAAAGILSTVANAISAFTGRFPNLSKGVALAVAAVLTFTAGSVALGLVINAVKTSINTLAGGLLRLSASQAAAAASGTALGAGETAAGAGARFFAGGLRSIMMATGVGAILVGLGYAISLLIDNWDAVVESMRGAWTWVTNTWTRLTIFFSELFNNLSTIFAGWGDTILNILLFPFRVTCAVWSGIFDFFSWLWAGISQAASSAWNAITGFTSWAYNEVCAIWDTISGFFAGIWQGIYEPCSGLWQDVTGLAAWAYNEVCAIWNTISGFFSGIVDSIFEVFRGLFKWLQEKFAWVFSTIDTVKGAISSIKGAVGSVVDSVKGAVTGAIDSAFGDGGKGDKAIAENAQKAVEKSAAKGAQEAANQTAAPVAKGAGKFTPVAREAVEGSGKKSGGGRKSGGGGGRKSGGGGRSGGSSRNAAGAATSASGAPVTVVSLGGDNNKIQTIHIPAGQLPGKTTSMAAQSTAPMLATSPDKALPRTPELIKNSGMKKQNAAKDPLTIELNQNFDIMSSDPAAFRKVMESLKPDFERLVRMALEKMQSDRRRTAYAQ